MKNDEKNERLTKFLEQIKNIAKTINPKWSNLEKATYLYVSILMAISPEIEKILNPKNEKPLSKEDKSDLYSTLYKSAMNTQDIPCNIRSSDNNHKFNEIMIKNTYYPLDLTLDVESNKEIMKKGGFLLTNYLSDKEFYKKPEHKIKGMTEEEIKNTPALDHSLIQDAINKTLGLGVQNKGKTEEKPIKEKPPIKIKTKEIQEIFNGKTTLEEKDIKDIKEFKINLQNQETEELSKDILEIGKYYPQILDNVTLSNDNDYNINMQQIVDAVSESKNNQEKTQGEVTPIKIAIESKNEADFNLDFSNIPEATKNKAEMAQDEDITQQISFVNKADRTLKMPNLEGKIPSTIDAISIRDFDVADLTIIAEPETPPNPKNRIHLRLEGQGTEGIADIRNLENIISLEIEDLSDSEFEDALNISIRNPNTMKNLYELNIRRQPQLRDRAIFREIRNPNIIDLTIYDPTNDFNNIEGFEDLKDQLRFLEVYSGGKAGDPSIANRGLSIEQVKELMSIRENRPYVRSIVDNALGTIQAIENLNRDELSNDTYLYLRELLRKNGNGIINVFRGANQKKDILMSMMSEPCRDIPYYIEDAKIFRETLPLKHNPMMIKDVATLENYLNDPSNYFEQDLIKDGTLDLTKEQLNALISSGKKIPQKINLTINVVKELDSSELDALKQACDNLGINLSGVKVFDQRDRDSAGKVFDGRWTHLEAYEVEEYKNIRKGIEEIVQGIDDSQSDVEKFARIYHRLSHKIYNYDKGAAFCTGMHSKEEAIYAYDKYNKTRNLSEGLIPQKGWNQRTDKADSELKNRCVCAGYADIFKNALNMVGVESIIDTGTVLEGSRVRGGHAWNRVKIDDKWYYADLCWDRGEEAEEPAPRTEENPQYIFALRGSDTFRDQNPAINPYDHSSFYIQKHKTNSAYRSETPERKDYDQERLKDIFERIVQEERHVEIEIPEDPVIQASDNLDPAKVKDEYERRKNDMYAKFYGDEKYEEEYNERSERFKVHEKEVTKNGITYRTIEDYDEREEDEKFLILDQYKNALERLTKYEAGDTSVYTGTPEEINEALERDREYVTTRNHTFNQNENTQKDLATLGKYGENLPYIPKQKGLLRNIGRGLMNTSIFLRNLTTPVYRFLGRHVAQPIHRFIRGNKDASPYKNNRYHRMVARRDYFRDIARRRDMEETQRRIAEADDPTKVKPVRHPIRNELGARIKAIFNAREGNEAVLRAGAYDIRQNMEEQQSRRIIVETLKQRTTALQKQVTELEEQINLFPGAVNLAEAQEALKRKKDTLVRTQDQLNNYLGKGEIANVQTDAIDQRQHDIASKEVNTATVTAIKGVALGLTARYIGPNIRNWLAERGKTVQNVSVTIQKEVPDNQWVPPVVQTVPETKTTNIIDKAVTLKDVMGRNKGKQISAFETVWGGERGPSTYTINGDEAITAIFQKTAQGGTGLSDKVGLTAPNLTEGLFKNELLDQVGKLNQNISIETLVNSVKSGQIDMSSIEDLYVSVGDKFWVKAKDILSSAAKTSEIETGNMIEKIVQPGHWIEKTKLVDEVINTTEVVDGPLVKGGDIMAGVLGAGIVARDVSENARTTDSEKDPNKKRPRNYEFDDGDNEEIPTSKKEYDER